MRYVNTVYVVIFAVVLFSRISRVRPREHFHFNICLFIVMKTSTNRETKISRISPISPKSRKYLCAKYMAYVDAYQQQSSEREPHLYGHEHLWISFCIKWARNKYCSREHIPMDVASVWSHCTTLIIQWNLIITRSLGPWKLPCYIRFLLISGWKNKGI